MIITFSRHELRLLTDTDRSKLGLIVIGQLYADLFGTCLASLLDALLPARFNH